VGASSAVLTIAGKLTVSGSATSLVELAPTTGARWGGVSVVSGGALDLTYAELKDASPGIAIAAGAGAVNVVHTHVTGTSPGMSISGGTVLVDHSNFDHAGGVSIDGDSSLRPEIRNSELTNNSMGSDFVVMNGRPQLYFHHNHIMDNHCSFHINAASNIDIEYNNFENAAYAFMLGGTMAGTITHNNFAATNGVDVLQISDNQAIMAQNNFWGSAAPKLEGTTPAFDASQPAAAAFTDVGPQP
jgi:hypothetical protein